MSISNYKKSFIVGWVLTCVSVVLEIGDEVLLNCVRPFKTAVFVFDLLDLILGFSWLLFILGMGILVVTRILSRRSRGDTYVSVVSETVVILIGLFFFASVILASMNSARSRGPDSYILSNLNTFRAHAELYFDSNGTYEGLCDSQSMQETQAKVHREVPPQGLLCKVPQITLDCFGGQDAYAVSSVLHVDSSKYYCVDSVGFTGRIDESVSGTSCK